MADLQVQSKGPLDIPLLLQKRQKGYSKDYDFFVNQLADPSLEASILCSHLQGLRNCVLVLNIDLEYLVGVILKIEWASRNNLAVVKDYHALILNLVSAHTIYVKACVRMIISQFIPKKKFLDDDLTVDETTRKEDENTFFHLHSLLRRIIQIVPMTPTVLLPLLSDMFPYLTKHYYVQECYMRNALQITTYLPSERYRIMELVVDRITKLDVRVPRHELEDAINDEEMDEDKELFKMEMDVETRPPHLDPKPSINHKDGHKLDVLMELIFKYICVVCHPSEELDWDATKKIYLELLKVFEKIILPTYASSHVQFFMFYICSFKGQLVEGFLDYLWKRVLDPNKSSVIRQAAVAYMASLLARGKYIPKKFVLTCLEMFSSWCHKYIQQVACSSTQPTVAHHGPFYSVCQAIFYVIAFRFKDILSTSKDLKIVQSLNLQTIVTCRLNPLNMCLPIVTNTFASIARSHQLAFCDTVLERNKRMKLPVTGSSVLSNTHLNPLDSFFPFDPYLLPCSSKYIVPDYQEYEGAVVMEEEEQDFEEDKLYEEENGISDLIAESPIRSATFATCSPVVSTDFMMYGESPGFKNL